jgi:biotin operon repressor
MTWVWDHSQARGNDRLVLLAIADHAHDDGAGAWPSQELLTQKTHLSESTVRRCIRSLEDLGELVTDRGRLGNRYRVDMTGRATGQNDRSDNGEGHSDRSDRSSVTGTGNRQEPSNTSSLREEGDDEGRIRKRQPTAAELIAVEALEDLVPRIQRGAGIDLGHEIVGRFRKAWALAEAKGVKPQSAGQAVLAAYYFAVTGEEATGNERAKIGRLVNNFQVLAVAGFEAAMKKDLEGDWLAYAWQVCKGLQRDHEIRQERGTA